MRTCPLCRSSTWFITPSTVWPLDPGEKEAIVDAYKSRLSKIVSSLCARSSLTSS